MKVIQICSQCGASLLRYQSKSGTYFCNKSCKGRWQTAQREKLGFTKEWLIDQYHVQGKSANKIAAEIGRDPKRVWEWIRDYGVETKPRGNLYGQGFKEGGVSPFKGRQHSSKTRELLHEISVKDGRVPYLVGGIHWAKLPENKGKNGNWKGGISPERNAFYGSDEWRTAVKTVWQRDDATCQRCQLKHNGMRGKKGYGPFHIHHIISFAVREKRSDPSNLVLLCERCHRWVHSRANVDKQFIGA
jgi:hypothetical protein